MPRSRKRQDPEHDLRREVQTLRRALARANREIARLQGVQEAPGEAEAAPPVQAAAKCPHCASANLGDVTTPSGKTIRSCKSCRKRIG